MKSHLTRGAMVPQREEDDRPGRALTARLRRTWCGRWRRVQASDRRGKDDWWREGPTWRRREGRPPGGAPRGGGRAVPPFFWVLGARTRLWGGATGPRRAAPPPS